MENRNGIEPTRRAWPAIAEHLRSTGMTQTDLGLQLGLSQPQVSMRMRGERRWQVAELAKLAEAWGTTIDALTRDAEITGAGGCHV